MTFPGRQAVQRRRLRDLLAYKLPGQTNRLALLFNPLDDGHLGVPFTFGLEVCTLLLVRSRTSSS
jgi:hypothetical protein